MLMGQFSMDILRRNTDYALRAMINLARNWQQAAVSTQEMAVQEDISYQLACKLLQKLHKAKLVESHMGPKGGFSLSKEPAAITMLDVVSAIQGPIKLNRCLWVKYVCSRKRGCPVHEKLIELQEYIFNYLYKNTLQDLLGNNKKIKGNKK
jgi:Rrf2 family transcriptional regulator, iron-sulfur cluster assembly transcription factor